VPISNTKSITSQLIAETKNRGRSGIPALMALGQAFYAFGLTTTASGGNPTEIAISEPYF